MANRLKKLMNPILKEECNKAFKRGFEEGKRAGWDERVLAYDNEIEFLKTVIRGLTKAENHQTNADRIRAMSDEELANFIPDWSYTNACKCDELPYVDCNNECEKCVLEWLKQPAEE